MAQPLIQIEELTKVFYTDEIETHALSGIHLTIAKGEYVAMSGPSGCGKSTLLSIIGLLDTPTGGKYELNGHAVESLNFAQRSRIRNQEIGFIFQSFNLIGDLTVYENVELPLTYRSGMTQVERKRRVQESLERVAMAHRIKHYPSQLSGGQQQRVAVARALAGFALYPARRRAYRKPGFAQRRSGDGAAAKPAQRGRHHLHGDPRSALCPPRRAQRPSLRRQGGRRG